MQTILIATLVAAAVALTVGLIVLFEQRRTARLATELSRTQQQLQFEVQQHAEILKAKLPNHAERQKPAARYREPLARAAYDLQSRLWNVLQRGFLQTYASGTATPRERDYAVTNTVFLIGQFFCWTEIVRREINFAEFEKDDETRRLSKLQDEISRIWGSDAFPERRFRIWPGEQRAIGELLMREGPRGLECIGYASFTNLLRTSRESLMLMLKDEVEALAEHPARLQRLALVQNGLIEMIELLDPQDLRFPRKSKSKVQS